MVLGTLQDGNENTTDLDLQQPVELEPQMLTAAGESEASPEGEGGGAEATTDAPQSMSEALLDEYDYERPKRGDVRQGVVLSVGPEEIVIDIGVKRECIVLASDFQKLGEEVVSQIRPGDEMTVYIVKPESREGHLIGSLYLAQLEVDWAHAEEYEKSGEIFEARVTGQNRGGVLVPFGRLRGFIPASHLIGVSRGEAEQPGSLNQWVGRTLPLKVIEVNRRRNRLILSYRAARRQWRSQQKQSLMETLSEGDVRTGIVSSLASFGAFVDLGGADGLIHVSEMAWYRVDHPSDLLQVGQEIEVYVLRVDSARGRIGLSLKRLQPDPWDLVDEKYSVGQLVEGTITKLVDFGTFVELEKGIEGLVHVSELADPAPMRPEEVVLPGETHLLRVLRVEPQNRRIGLSLKDVTPAEREAWEERRAAEAESAMEDAATAETEAEAPSMEDTGAEPEADSSEAAEE